jgi:CYTH domain-containing protein
VHSFLPLLHLHTETNSDQTPPHTGTIKHATTAKVAVFTCALDVTRTETEGTVLIKNADEMLNFMSGKEGHLEKVRHFLTFFLFLSERRRELTDNALHSFRR